MSIVANRPVEDYGYPVPLPMEPITLVPMRHKGGVLTGAVPVSPGFWGAWKRHKRDFLSRGYTIKKEADGTWILSQWLAVNSEGLWLTKFSKEKLAQLDAQELFQQENRAAEPVVPSMQIDPGTLPPLPHGLEDKLYPYQRHPARQLFRALMHGPEEYGKTGAFDCSMLGVGKTYMSLAAAIATGLEVGVICPLSVIGTFPKHGERGTGWRGAFAHFGQSPAFIHNYESLRTGKFRDILTRDKSAKMKARAFEWKLKAQDTILIWDESHYLRGNSLNRGMAIAAIRQGLGSLFVSGTMAESPLHMAATGFGIGLHEGTRSSYEQFLGRFGCYSDGGGWQFLKGPQGARHLAHLHAQIFPQRGVRVRIQDLVGDDSFPETQIICEPCYVEQHKQIDEAFKAAQATIEKLKLQGKPEHETRMLEMSAYMHAWHESERLKVPDIARMALDEMDNGRSVAIFVNFTDVRLELQDRFKTHCAIFGGQSARHRASCIADFQDDRSRIIIANISAGGVGVSLHDINGTFPRTSIILPTNNATAMGQAFGRVHRAGGKSQSRQIVMFAADTIEAAICAATRRKMANVASLNDGELCPPTVLDDI